MKRIKVEDIVKSGHNLMNDIVMETAKVLNEAYFVIKIDDLLKERNISQKELAQMTGMRIGTISDLANGKGSSLNKVQLLALMVALRVTSLSDLYEIKLPDDIMKSFENDSREWKNSREMPSSVKDMYRDNVLKTLGLNI